MAIRELVTSLKFNVDNKGFGQFDNLINSSKAKINALSSSLNNLKSKISSNYRQMGSVLSGGSFKTQGFPNQVSAAQYKAINTSNENIVKLNKSLETLKNRFHNLNQTITPIFSKFVKGTTAAITGMTALSVSTSNNIRQTKILAEQLGITTQQLQVFELTGQAAGLRTDELSKSFQRFNANLGSVGSPYTTIKTELDSLNIATTNNGKEKAVLDLYIEVIEKLNNLKDSSRQSFLLHKLFGSNNRQLLTLFDKTKGAFSDQAAEILKLSYIIDNKAVKTSEEFITSWKRFGIILGGIKTELSLKFMPVFSDNIKLFEKFYVNNRELISQNLQGFINILSASFNLLVKVVGLVLKPIMAFIDLMGGIENAVSIVAGTLGILFIPKLLSAVSALRAFVTLLMTIGTGFLSISGLIVLAAAALAGFANDIYHWVMGNDSALGRALGSWEDFYKKTVDIFGNMTSYIKNQFTALGDWISNFWNNTIDTISSKFNSFSMGKTRLEKLKDRVDQAAKNAITPVPNQQGKSKLDLFRDRVNKEAIINPTNLLSSKTANKQYIEPKINQSFNQKITVNVPEGTSVIQSQAISDQVSLEVQRQFNYNMLRGIDAVGN